MKLSSNNYMCTCAGKNKYNEHLIPVTIYISYAQLASKTDLRSAIIESQETLDNCPVLVWQSSTELIHNPVNRNRTQDLQFSQRALKV